MKQYGASVASGTTEFRVRSPEASALWLCLFDGDAEARHAMFRDGEDWVVSIPQDLTGSRYGYRAEGEWAPRDGRWFDPSKLLVDPYAVELDRRFMQDPSLAQFGADTAAIVPRAVVQPALPDVPLAPPVFERGGLVYELPVAGFSALHPEVPKRQRGTVAALSHPSIIEHLRKLHVTAVELMPIVAWIDERHLPPLGLANHWGYNPVAMMALDPVLCPGGVSELRDTVAALHKAGIGVILDIVLNHTGESDTEGGVISLRGLADDAYAKGPDGRLINDTGCGNTLDFANPKVRQLAIATLRHFVRHCSIDGFRFDLAPVLARGPGFSAEAPIFAEIAADPWLADRIMIAEPWDIGPGGYQLGNFPENWLEWNDRYRDDVRRFWKGEGAASLLATRMAGSSDIFGKNTRSVNFLAAHDGFTLADLVAYEERHNEANGEGNRDGHSENFSWNNGVEGPSDDRAVRLARDADVRALLGTLFSSAGTIMLTAGDEFGRSQRGNNNAYCQSIPIEWDKRDRSLEDYTAGLAAIRSNRLAPLRNFPENGTWSSHEGAELTPEMWQDPALDGFRFEAWTEDHPFAFSVSRSDRLAKN